MERDYRGGKMTAEKALTYEMSLQDAIQEGNNVLIEHYRDKLKSYPCEKRPELEAEARRLLSLGGDR